MFLFYLFFSGFILLSDASAGNDILTKATVPIYATGVLTCYNQVKEWQTTAKQQPTYKHYRGEFLKCVHRKNHTMCHFLLSYRINLQYVGQLLFFSSLFVSMLSVQSHIDFKTHHLWHVFNFIIHAKMLILMFL